MLLLLAIAVVFVVFVALPCWGMHDFGWYPVSILGLALILVLLYVLVRQP